MICKTFCFVCFYRPALCRVCVFIPVTAWLESMTRLDSSHVEKDGDSTRVTFFTEWLHSSHNQWLEIRVRVIFAKSQRLWSTNPVWLHTKKWSFFGPVMIKRGANFLFWLSSRVILYPNGQVFITCTEVDLRFAFHWGARRAQYRPIDKSSWSNQVFAYRDNGSRPHTVTLSLFQMKWFELFEYKSYAKIYRSI